MLEQIEILMDHHNGGKGVFLTEDREEAFLHVVHLLSETNYKEIIVRRKTSG